MPHQPFRVIPLAGQDYPCGASGMKRWGSDRPSSLISSLSSKRDEPLARGSSQVIPGPKGLEDWRRRQAGANALRPNKVVKTAGALSPPQPKTIRPGLRKAVLQQFSKNPQVRPVVRFKHLTVDSLYPIIPILAVRVFRLTPACAKEAQDEGLILAPPRKTI